MNFCLSRQSWSGIRSPLYAIHPVAVFIILSNYHLQCSLHQKSLSRKCAAYNFVHMLFSHVRNLCTFQKSCIGIMNFCLSRQSWSGIRSPLYAIHPVAVFIILSNYHLQCSLHQKSLSRKCAAYNFVHMLFSHVHNLCTFQKSTAILLGITPLLMLWNSLLLTMRTSSSLIIFKMC